MSQVTIKMAVVSFIRLLLFSGETYTCAQMNHVSIKMTVVSVITLLLFPQESYTVS